MVPEEQATGRVRGIYEEIKSTFGIDFVPNMHKVMVPNPAYLEANWSKVKAVMIASGKLDRLTKEISSPWRCRRSTSRGQRSPQSRDACLFRFAAQFHEAGRKGGPKW